MVNALIKTSDISIIIPFHRNKNMLMTSLSTLESTIPNDVEVIIVANNQDPNEIDIKLSDRYTLYRIFSDIMWPGAINFGVEHSTRKYVVFCDPDIFYLDGWLEALVICYASHERVGAVGAKLINPQNGRILDFGMAYCTYNVAHTMKGHMPNHPLALEDRQTQSVCGAVLLTTKILFNQVGGINPSMPYIYCDNDYCLRVIQMGYTVWLAANACVFHKGSTDKNNSKNVMYSFLREDSKAAFYTQSNSLKKIDISDWMLEFWDFFKKENIHIEDKYILFNFCTLLDNHLYVDVIKNKMGLNILEEYRIRVPQRDMPVISLYNYIPKDMIAYHTPFLYFVDEFTSLQNNELWYALRNIDTDLVVDRHGTIVSMSQIMHKSV